MTEFDGAIEIATEMIQRFNAGIEQGFDDFDSDAHVTTIEYSQWFDTVEERLKERFGENSKYVSGWRELIERLENSPWEADTHVLRRYIDELKASISYLKMLPMPQVSGTSKPHFLSDQRWTGIGAIFAILAVLVAIVGLNMPFSSSNKNLSDGESIPNSLKDDLSNDPTIRPNENGPKIPEPDVSDGNALQIASQQPHEPELACEPIPISNSTLKARFISDSQPQNCAVAIVKGGLKIWTTHVAGSNDPKYSFGDLSFVIENENGIPTPTNGIEVTSAIGVWPNSQNRLICSDISGNQLHQITFGDGETARCQSNNIARVDIQTDHSFGLAKIKVP